MKNNNSLENLYGWFDVSNNLDDERNWTNQYIELNLRKRTLTFHRNECIRTTNNGIKSMPVVDLSCDMGSISSSSSSSSLYKKSDRRSSINVLQANSMLPTLSERISPSLSKTILSPLILTDDQKTSPIYPSSFTDSSSDRSSSKQSRMKFSHFFNRSSNHIEHFLPSLKRAKSATKLERQKHSVITQNQQSFLNIPSNRCRSHESLLILNGPLGSIIPFKPTEIMLNNYHIRRLHRSILPFSHLNNNQSSTYIQIRNQNQNQTCYLRSKQNLLLLKHLQNLSSLNTINGSRTDNSLEISILEAKGLPAKKKYYVKIFLNDDIYGKTTSIERRDILFWGENFVFKDISQSCSTLRCKLYIERRKQKQYDVELIGCVDIPLSTITGNQFIEHWYSIQFENTKEKLEDGSVNIRIKAKYQTIDILSIDSYSNLQEYIRRNYLQLIEILEPHISLKDKDDIATSLTRIAHSLSYSSEYLVDIIQAELSSTSDKSLTFRGNSIATKSMESYMKLIGEKYLRDTLTYLIRDIVSSKHFNDIDLEVDPDRIINMDNLEHNQITLKRLCEQIWLHIQQSYISFPYELKLIFSKLRQISPSNETMLNFLSGSIFLRFLCPAILSPNLFGLTQEYPSEKASRKLTLIAKTIQTLANFSKFGSKESYMNFMNHFISKESDNMRRFLINISRIDSNESSIVNEEDIDLGREYAILHRTLANLFEELDGNIRQSLNQLEYILQELSYQICKDIKQTCSTLSLSKYSSLYDSERSLSRTINDYSNNSHMKYLLSTDNQIPAAINSTISPLKIDEQISKTQQLPPKILVKPSNNPISNKNLIYSQRSPMFTHNPEEKCCRVEYEKQMERLGNIS